MPIVEVPGHGDVEFPDDMTDEQIAAAIKKNLAPTSRASDPSLYSTSDALKNAALKYGKQAGRMLGLTGYAMASAPMSIPMAAMDFGIGARNLMTGSNYDTATKMWDDSFAIKPETTAEKISNFGMQALIGSKIPSPTIANPAPSNFIKPQSMQQFAFQAGRNEGAVVPPSTIKPTLFNRAMESIGGKVATEQDASLINQSKFTDKLVNRALGLKPETELAESVLPGVREQAANVYRKIAQSGDIVPDAQFATAIKELPKSVADDLSTTARNSIDPITLTSQTKSLTAGQLLEKVKDLRFNAQRNLSPMAAQNPESAALGRAQKKAADLAEDLLMRHLRKSGLEDVADEFADARKLIAKTHSVEDAVVAGQVSANKLASQLARGKPLSGELKSVAQFSQQFPKATKRILDSGSVRNTDVILGAGAAALEKQPAYLVYPLLRQMVRKGLLSDTYQNMLAKPPQGIPPEWVMGGTTGLLGP